MAGPFEDEDEAHAHHPTDQQSQTQSSADGAESQEPAASPASQNPRLLRPGRQASRASSSHETAGKKNYMWTAQDINTLVTVLFNNPCFQVAPLPSRMSGDEPINKLSKLNKTAVERSIFKSVFPNSEHVEPDRIKSKIRWPRGLYSKQKKKLSLPAAGFLEGMDSSEPTRVSRAALAAKHPCNEAAIMHDRDVNKDGHSGHGHGLPPLDDLVHNTVHPAMLDFTAGGAVESQSQSVRSETPMHLLTSGTASGTRRCSTPSTPAAEFSSAFTTTPTSAGKRTRAAAEQTKDAIADAFDRFQKETMQTRLQLEQEKTKREDMRPAVEQLKIQAESDTRNALREQTAAMLRMQQAQSQNMTEVLRLLAGRNASHTEAGAGSSSTSHDPQNGQHGPHYVPYAHNTLACTNNDSVDFTKYRVVVFVCVCMADAR
ncbi:hypothetical protein EX895_002991 [Sporisorium graminicola]|uniref:Uncharacterized protein n=1 Tax=Sporisorium graminicola TaxID=280036 RepID=A0A4U7KTR1_9BASI|nr:hypothetical protein EX895_002986 [Sporisorium graminicola]XP_029739880.1 hypothetical protein EX895_002991 [Sporisorium graminicola]TKY87890.1 hypothetical protein EX895_002986 [Sporisorium graminicola]TKY87895.1 hypothetical protein EX895_002991 [Sporisorium graminicola]